MLIRIGFYLNGQLYFCKEREYDDPRIRVWREIDAQQGLLLPVKLFYMLVEVICFEMESCEEIKLL